MALHIHRHSPTEESTNLNETPEMIAVENGEITTPIATRSRVPTIKVESRRTPDTQSIDKVATAMIRAIVEQTIAEQTPAMLQKLRKEMRQCEDQTLTHTTEMISQARQRFETSIKEMIEVDLLPHMSPETVSEIANLLGETKESQSRKERALLTMQHLQDAIALENKTDQLRESHWENSTYTPQEMIKTLCELVSTYIPADSDAAKQSSLQESEEMLTHSKYMGDGERAVASNKETYLQNTPVYRAVLLFRAAKIDCDSLALCSKCPFRSKGEECRLWKMAFALHDIAFYRAQSVSQAQYEDTVAQKLAEAQIEISSLKQQIAEERLQFSALQDKFDKITSGSKHLTSAHKKQGDTDNYETELDPYLRFR